MIKPDFNKWWLHLDGKPVATCKECAIYLHRSYLECPSCKEPIDWSEYDSTAKEN